MFRSSARSESPPLPAFGRTDRMWKHFVITTTVAAIFAVCGPCGFAQERPSATAEAFGGYAGFVDEETVSHAAFGGAARLYLLPRVAVGPELVYMIGPDSDRDLVVTGNVTFDFLGGRRAATPFVIAGGGLFHHSNRFGTRSFSSTEGSFTGGGGVRVWLSKRVYVAPEFRIGWEPHYRVGVAVGWRLRD